MSEIVLEKDGHWFHDGEKGRYYYKNHLNYLQGIRNYLIKCHRCEDWIYPKESICFDRASRLGLPLIHQRCR